MGLPELLFWFLIAILLFGSKNLQQRLAEGISNFRPPRPPTHPIPGNDSRILNRRRARSGQPRSW